LWSSAQHDLTFYPNVITLRPDVTAGETAPARNRARRWAVKDSFALLDLAADGLTVLFEAEWIARPVLGYRHRRGRAGPVGAAWAQGDSSAERLFRPKLLADRRCAILACRRGGDLIAGIIAYTAAGVTGISNLFGAGLPVGRRDQRRHRSRRDPPPPAAAESAAAAPCPDRSAPAPAHTPAAAAREPSP
jgi:hypothetical protein